MILYIKGKEHGRTILDSFLNRPLVYGTIEVDGVTRTKTYEELSNKVKLQDDCDIRATNIFLQGLQLDVYSLQECECKLYNEFDRFTLAKGESNHEYYSRFAQLINDMHTIGMTMHPVQLYAYLSQHEVHAIEVRLMYERFLNPLALVANYHHIPSYQNTHQSQYDPSCYQQQLSPVAQQFYYSQPHLQSYELPCHQQHYQDPIGHSTPFVPQHVYQAPTISQQSQVEFPQLDSGLVVPSFIPGEDLIASLNKAMAFLSTTIASCYPTTNYQLRTNSNLRNQATNQDGRVTVQQVQGRQSQSFAVLAQESDQVLDEEQLAFLADPGYAEGQDIQTTMPHNAAFQTDDLDAFDLDCDEAPSTKAVLMANLSSYDSYAILKCSIDKKCFEIQKKELLLKNDQLLELIISQDLVHTAVNSLAAIVDYQSMKKSYIEEYNRNLTLAAKLSKMNELSKTCLRLENHCISFELKLQQNKEIFKITDLFVINDLKAQLQAKESLINKLRAHIATLKGKSMSDNNVYVNNANVITPRIFRLDLEPLSSKLKKNMEAHVYYLQETKEHTDSL
ncbi:hypothetical protein Tco_0453226 [Tanacetum coccineum]